MGSSRVGRGRAWAKSGPFASWLEFLNLRRKDHRPNGGLRRWAEDGPIFLLTRLHSRWYALTSARSGAGFSQAMGAQFEICSGQDV